MNPESYRTGHRTCHHKIYTLTCAEFDEVLRRCGNRCEICKTPAAETPRGVLCIDHDQRRGWSAVRGMLCDKCNSHMRFVDVGARPIGPTEARYYGDAWFRTPGWYGTSPSGDVISVPD